MSALGQKQTFAVQNAMSALHPIADMCGATRYVRHVPMADIVYSITSSALARRAAGTARPKIRAVWALITSSNLIVSATVVALLVNPNDSNAASFTTDAQVAAATLGLQVRVVNAATEADFDSAFVRLVNERASAMLVTVNALFINHREKLVALAARHAMPAMYDRREFPAAGGLMSYGASIIEQYRQSGVYIGKILGGAKPADLPVLQPTKFELVVNLKAAKAVGLTVPPSLLARADEVIE